jgi:hypothetical protein
MISHSSHRLRVAVRAGSAARGLIRTCARPGGHGVLALAQWAVLVVLADVVAEDGRMPDELCVPTAAGTFERVPTTIPNIARLAPVEERLVRRALPALEAQGLLQVEKRPGRADRYRLVMDTLLAKALARPSQPPADVGPDAACSLPNTPTSHRSRGGRS